MWRKMTEKCDTIIDDFYLAHRRFHSGKPDRLSVEFLAVQLPEPEAAMVG